MRMKLPYPLIAVVVVSATAQSFVVACLRAGRAAFHNLQLFHSMGLQRLYGDLSMPSGVSLHL